MEYEKEYSINNIVQQDAANYLINMIDLPQPKRILDIGCGSGNVTHKLNLKYPNAIIDAIDPLSKMINIAKNIYPSSNLNFICQKMEDFTPEYDYDLVFSNSSFQWWERHDIALSRIADVLAPSGIVAIQTPYRDLWCEEIITLVEQVFNTHFPELYQSFKFPCLHLETKEQFQDLLLHSGLTPSTIKAHSFTYNVNNEEIFKIFKSGAVKVYTSDDYFDVELPKDFQTDFLQKFKVLISNDNVQLSLHRMLLLCNPPRTR
jgi:trans-aconitate 2-methyltransferase